jgi:cation transport regulator ChaB
MPTTKEDLPSTLKRSPAKARRTYAKALDNAHKEYKGDEERAHRVAFSALKHSFKKVGDHWEPKSKKGPSDPQAAKSGAAARRSRTPTAGGKDVGTTKQELMEEARKRDIPGRSRMSKDQLLRALRRAKR